ncbi:MAG: hypothetical protein ACE5GO_07225, partial [Anaerolineales bacterium]
MTKPHQPVRTSLRSQLERSHLAVTLLSVLILETLVVVGYVVYLQTDFVAYWAGEQAAFLADEIAWGLDNEGLTSQAAGDYILWSGVSLLDGLDEGLPGPDETDWLVIFTPDWRVLASNVPQTFPEGAVFSPDQLP